MECHNQKEGFYWFLAGCGVLAVAALAISGPILAATACVEVSCSMACNPANPVQISTLIGPTDFPPNFDTPTAFVDPGDGSERRLIADQEGVILVWDGSTRSILPTPYLDIQNEVACCSERGLLALAVDPDFANTGEFYVFYTAASAGPGDTGDVVIERYRQSTSNPNVADVNSATTIMVIDHPASNHNGGWLAFGPNDGFLYISTGDGGGSCDSNQGANGDGQSLSSLAGKLLRIDVRGVDGSAGQPDDCGNGPANYTVPSSNPYQGQEPACDEIFDLGLRNPFRFSFDRTTGDIYIGDVGQLKWEEINLQDISTTPAPVNFGWSCREGCETSNNNESGCGIGGCPLDTGTSCEFPRSTGSQGGHWDPILCHHNGGWRSIMGGYRYRGSMVPSIAGDYFYGDNACGQIWKTTSLNPANPAAISSSCWSSGHGGTYGFGEDHLGELYIVRGGASRIECIHNGEGCFWAGWGIVGIDMEDGTLDGWSESSP